VPVWGQIVLSLIAEGNGATFVNNVLSQHAGRIAGILTFGGDIDPGIEPGAAVPAYLAGANDAAVSFWKEANGVDSEPEPGIFVNRGYVQKKVTVAEEGFVVIAPDYDSQNPDQILSVVGYAKKTYPIDKSRIYVTGFSMGGATTGNLGPSHPEIFAAMSPMGATGGISTGDKAADFDIPFCTIVGSIDSSNVKTNEAGQPVIAGIANGTLEALLDFDEIEYGSADYGAYPFWGYKPDKFDTITDKNLTFEVNSFHKEGYANPMVQLVTFIGAGHANADYMATIAWDFMKQFARGEDGSVIER